MPQSKDDLRRERLREFDARLDKAVAAVAVMGLIVQAREARAWPVDAPLEVAFAAAAGDEARALPAGVWVALRRDDVDAAVEALVGVSDERFVIGEREELGDGYRLQTVEEARTLPDVGLLQAQLAAMLDIPRDVVAILTEWGPDDSRTRAEIDALLDSRFGPVTAAPATAAPAAAAPAAAAPAAAAPAAPATPAASAATPAQPRLAGTLTMSVTELADVLQLTPPQGKVLATLVRRAGLTVTED